jgi:8-oxo-dGTP pyrophosphatase MutT (NUDIX family)
MPTSSDPGVIEAAGGVVEISGSNGPRIAVIHRTRHGDEWALPKGKRESGETWEGTALREVSEEIGLKPVITGIAGASAYLAKGVPKLVFYWRMRVEGVVPPFEPNDEVVALDWLSPEEAIERLTHREEVMVVQNAFARWTDTTHSMGGHFDRLMAPIWRLLRRRRLKRLASDISVYKQVLSIRADCGGCFNLLNAAEIAVEEGNVDSGWKYLHAARRVELLTASDAELQAAAIAIRKESDAKLSSWRRAAVEKILPLSSSARPDGREVYRAAWLLDEHFSNEAYRSAVHRTMIFQFLLFLVVSLGGVLWLAQIGYLGSLTEKSAALVPALLCVAVFGLLGATTSAITEAIKPQSTKSIPELGWTFRVTLLRLLMGPASAIVLYFAVQTSFGSALFNSATLHGYGILIVAFFSGFSERLVLRLVKGANDAPKDR